MQRRISFQITLFWTLLVLCGWGRVVSAQQLAWQTPAPSAQAFYVTPDGTSFVADSDGTLRSISAAGQVNWTFALGSPVQNKLVPTSNGGVVVTTQDSRIVSVSSAGQKQWEATLPAIATGAPAVGADGTVYVAADTKLFAYSSTGASKWTFDDNNLLTGNVAVGTAGVAVGADEGGLYLVDLSGKQLFHYAVAESVAHQPTVAAGGTASYLNTTNRIEGLSATGDQVWTLDPESADGKFMSGMETEHNGTLYIVEDALVRAVGPDGKIAWTFDTTAGVSAPLVLTSDNHLLVGTTDKRFVTLDAATGNKLSEATLPTAPSGVGTASGGRIFALIGGAGPNGGGANLLAAFVPTDTTPPLWVRTGLADNVILDLARNPADSNSFFASADKLIAASTDGGKTWTPTSVDVPSGDTNIFSLAVASNGVVFGSTQTFVYANTAAGKTDYGIVSGVDETGSVAVDSKDPNHIVFADSMAQTTYDSPDKGVNLQSFDAPAIFTDLYWASDGTLYAASKDGLYKKPSGGDWTQAAEGRTTSITSTADGKTVLAGGEGRILVSGDSGGSFTEVKSNQLIGTVYRIAVNPTNPAQVMVGTVITADTLSGGQGINMLYSSDSGHNWQVIDKGLASVSPNALAGGDGYFLLGSNEGVWRIDVGGGGTTPTGPMPGDLTGDKKVNVADATLALQIAVGIINPTADQLKAGDVAPAGAPDGKIGVTDATRILRAAVGLEQL